MTLRRGLKFVLIGVGVTSLAAVIGLFSHEVAHLLIDFVQSWDWLRSLRTDAGVARTVS